MYQSLNQDQLNKELAKYEAIENPNAKQKRELKKIREAIASKENNTAATQAAKDMAKEGIEFSMPVIESSSNGNGLTGRNAQVANWFKENLGKGLTMQEARDFLFSKPDHDNSGSRSRKAIREAQAKLRLQGFATLRFQAIGNKKIYFVVNAERVDALKKWADEEGLIASDIPNGR